MTMRKEVQDALIERGIDENAFEMLIAHGRRVGSLRRDDVADIIPEAEFDGPLTDLCVRAIEEEGVPVEEEPAQALNAVEPENPAAAEYISLSNVAVDDVLSLYLRDAAQVPLLTFAEEQELARRIEQSRLAHAELSREEEQAAPLRRQELQRVIEDGRLAREHLIRANARLVISVARRFNGRGLPLSDLIQEGNIGLMRAIRNFDYRRGFKFSTYATWWIRQAMGRALADQARTIRLPAYLSDQLGRLRRVQLDLQQRLSRIPNVDELSEAMGMSPARIEQMLDALAQPISLEQPVNEEDESELGELLEDANALDPEEIASEHMDGETMRGMLARLPARERQVIELRYGLGGEEPQTLAEVGARLGITRERARQLEVQAINRLRTPEGSSRRRRFK